MCTSYHGKFSTIKIVWSVSFSIVTINAFAFGESVFFLVISHAITRAVHFKTKTYEEFFLCLEKLTTLRENFFIC